MVIIFQEEKAREFLLEKGYVVTARARKRKTGFDWMTDRRGGKKIADVHIIPLKTILPRGEIEYLKAILKDYAPDSGFLDVEEWIKAIIRVHKGLPEEVHLYGVILLKGRKYAGVA